MREVKPEKWRTLDLGDSSKIHDTVAELTQPNPEQVSMYRSSCEKQTELVAVARSVRHNNRKPFRYIEIDSEDISAVGGRNKRSHGNLAVRIVNRWHVDVELANGRAESLVKLVRGRGPIEVKRVPHKTMIERAHRLWWWQHQIEKNHWLLS